MIFEKLWQIDSIQVIKDLCAQICSLKQHSHTTDIRSWRSHQVLPSLNEHGQERALKLLKNKLELLQNNNVEIDGPYQRQNK